MPNYFKGRMFKHPDFVAVEESETGLKEYTKAFKNHWFEGFDPVVGKDSILSFPDIYRKNAIGRAHLKQIHFEDKTYSSSEAAWTAYAINDGDIVPTSNSFLIYCVSESRDACILAYLDGGKVDSHTILCDVEFRKSIRDKANMFYSAFNTKAMPINEHNAIFSRKWVNEEAEDDCAI